MMFVVRVAVPATTTPRIRAGRPRRAVVPARTPRAGRPCHFRAVQFLIAPPASHDPLAENYGIAGIRHCHETGSPRPLAHPAMTFPSVPATPASLPSPLDRARRKAYWRLL